MLSSVTSAFLQAWFNLTWTRFYVLKQGKDCLGTSEDACARGANSDLKRANQIFTHCENSSNWVAIPVDWKEAASWQATMKEMQAQVNQGAVIIAVWQNPTGASGHVMGLVSGEVQYSRSCKGNLVVVMDTGDKTRVSSQLITGNLSKAKLFKTKFFRYQGSLKK